MSAFNTHIHASRLLKIVYVPFIQLLVTMARYLHIILFRFYSPLLIVGPLSLYNL